MSEENATSRPGPYADHYAFVNALTPIAPVGNVTLRKDLGWSQVGRFRRVRNTLIGLEVVRFDGGRGGSARLALGNQDLDTAIAAGLDLQASREIATYPLLLDPIDRMITAQYVDLKDRISASDEGDGVRPYVTAAKRAGRTGGVYTRPDITVLVDLEFPSLGPWNDVHSLEVKPYWAVERDGLFEAAAQAALRRCTHSWLVAYIPPPDSPGMNAEQKKTLKAARSRVGTKDQPGRLSEEARDIGIGVAVATSLREGTDLEVVVEAARVVMDPVRADELFASLGRLGG